MKKCVLEERTCNGCGECDLCDLDASKKCNNCMECLEMNDDYKVIEIDEVILPNSSH